MTVRLGLLGDIHAEDARLAAALAVFAREGCDAILFVGDIVDGVGDVDRCVALLQASRAIGVRGNHERWLLDDTMRTLPDAHQLEELSPRSAAFLRELPATRTVATPMGPLLLCHGVGDDDMQRLRQDDVGYGLQSNTPLARVMQDRSCTVMVGGHTHHRAVRRFSAREVLGRGDSSLLYVNAGTLAPTDLPCCSVLDVEAGVVQFFELEDAGSPLRSERVPLP